MSDKKELRRSGLTASFVLCIWTGVLFWRGKDFYFVFLVFSMVFLFFGALYPMALKPLHKILTKLITTIGQGITFFLLGALFYLMITPLALIAKFFNKKFLDLRFRDDSESFWIEEKKVFDKSDYEHPY